ncbi:hypothetical protein ACA910_014382 [Epithemia clementina (nom. ined.)]
MFPPPSSGGQATRPPPPLSTKAPPHDNDGDQRSWNRLPQYDQYHSSLAFPRADTTNHSNWLSFSSENTIITLSLSSSSSSMRLPKKPAALAWSVSQQQRLVVVLGGCPDALAARIAGAPPALGLVMVVVGTILTILLFLAVKVARRVRPVWSGVVGASSWQSLSQALSQAPSRSMKGDVTAHKTIRMDPQDSDQMSTDNNNDEDDDQIQNNPDDDDEPQQEPEILLEPTVSHCESKHRHYDNKKKKNQHPDDDHQDNDDHDNDDNDDNDSLDSTTTTTLRLRTNCMAGPCAANQAQVLEEEEEHEIVFVRCSSNSSSSNPNHHRDDDDNNNIFEQAAATVFLQNSGDGGGGQQGEL